MKPVHKIINVTFSISDREEQSSIRDTEPIKKRKKKEKKEK